MPTKLLIVDDSALMRRTLTQIFETAGGFEIQTARDGLDALRMVSEWNPDVITLDINMPKLDGLSALSEIMAHNPRPVVIVSSLTTQNALPTLEALALGAVDVVAKPSGTVSQDMRKVERELIDKTRAALRAKIKRKAPRASVLPARNTPPPAAVKHEPITGLVLVGVSTGGPRTLEDILPQLPADLRFPVLVAIHMPVHFTGTFAKRIDELCALTVMEVTRNTRISAGHIYIARGGADMIVSQHDSALTVGIAPPLPDSAWQPNIDRMVMTAMRYVKPQALIGVQLTGMGEDGAAAMKALHDAGGRTIAESEETAVIFGMPRELIERKGASCVLPCDRIAQQVVRWVNARR